MFAGWSSEQITISAALLALIGVSLNAATTALSSRNSKYVETIARERIKWVGELRTDFCEFIAKLSQLRHAINRKQTALESDLSIKGYESIVLLAMKLNPLSPLDREILTLMQLALDANTIQNNDIKAEVLNGMLRRRVGELLKEEWETAKIESSGLLQTFILKWKRMGRWDTYRQRWRDRPLTSPKHLGPRVLDAADD